MRNPSQEYMARSIANSWWRRLRPNFGNVTALSCPVCQCVIWIGPFGSKHRTDGFDHLMTHEYEEILSVYCGYA